MGLIPVKRARPKRLPALVLTHLRKSLVNGMRSSHRVGLRNMATAFCSDSKMISFRGWANERSEGLRLRNCSQYCAESKAEVLLKLRIVRSRTAGKRFAML